MSRSTDVYIIGVASTAFQKWPDRTFRDLASEVVREVLEDAGWADGGDIGSVYFGNCAMDVWGQSNIRGQVALRPMLREGRLPERVPILNVEAGCATGSVAFHQAVKDVRAGGCEVALAVGVEKTFVPDDPMKTYGLFLGGIDQLHPEEWRTFYAEAGERGGQRFEPDPRRIIFLDIHAMQARAHMARHGTSVEAIAAVASKNHNQGRLNARAQHRFGLTPAQVLEDRPIIDPLTRAMCAPISDGAAAVLVCSAERLATLDPALQARAIRVRGTVLVGGAYRELNAPSVVAHAGAAAYRESGLRPEDVDLAEVHDATAFCELHAYEALGFCPEGEGGAYALSGATQADGARPVNLSGGLIAKGHPLAASGLGMLQELVAQLRGEADDHQAPRRPRIALQQNAGGCVGFDEALCSVVLLERAD